MPTLQLNDLIDRFDNLSNEVNDLRRRITIHSRRLDLLENLVANQNQKYDNLFADVLKQLTTIMKTLMLLTQNDNK